MKSTKLTFFALTFVTAFLLVRSADASIICNAFRYPVLELQLKNCERLVASGAVKNKSALAASIRFMMRNYQTLQDPSCALVKRSHSPACVTEAGADGKKCSNMADPEWIRKGFDNRCSFFINDLTMHWDKSCKGTSCRTTGYYVDLCAAKSDDLFSSFYFNGAPGRPTDNTPAPGEHGSNNSVLAGAFKLDGAVSDLYIGSDNKRGEVHYSGIQHRNGRVPAIHMIGLNSSNNVTDYDKPLHVSAYHRGLGCPGVSESTAEILTRATQGQRSTLYMAYAGPEFEQRGSSCENTPASAQRASSGVRIHRGSAEQPSAN